MAAMKAMKETKAMKKTIGMKAMKSMKNTIGVKAMKSMKKAMKAMKDKKKTYIQRWINLDTKGCPEVLIQVWLDTKTKTIEYKVFKR